MKKQFLAIFSIVFVMTFAVAVYAFKQPTASGKKADSCCAKKDNCPLKGKNAPTTENAKQDSCCDKADCCCKSGACPRKASGEKASEDCCGNCGGGSCPMKNKQTETISAETKAESCQHNSTVGS